MKHFYDLNGVVPGPTRMAFGSFDGLHLGHRAVLRRLRGYEGQIPVVVSFAEAERPVIYTESEKEYLLSGMSVESMVSLSRAMVQTMTAEDFCRRILCSRLQAKTVVAGENLCFGSDGQGAKELVRLGEKLTLELYSYIRGVRKFNGLDEVCRQIDQDVLTVQSFMDRVVEEMRVQKISPDAVCIRGASVFSG